MALYDSLLELVRRTSTDLPQDLRAALLAGRARELVGSTAESALNTIAWSGQRKPELDEPIITPFVIPTVLASLWCVLRHGDSWSRAVASAIKLGGDVDTLGAIVGALMGAKLGLAAIPGHLVDNVLDSEKLRGIAVRYCELVNTTTFQAAPC